MESVESNKINFIHLLLKHGADPHIRNNDGETAMSVSPPFIQEILGSEVKQRMLKERRLLKEAAGGSLRSCIACGGQKDGNKRCTGCYLVMYCSKTCQVKHWKEHSHKCKVSLLDTLSMILKCFLFHVENSVRIQNGVLVGYLHKWNMQHNRQGIKRAH